MNFDIEKGGITITDKRIDSFYRFMDAIYAISDKVDEYESIPRQYGTEDYLYMAEVHMLDLIGKKGKTTTSELSDVTNKTLSAVSQTVDKLVKKDLVIKRKNITNLRQIFIELTEKGHVVYHFHKELDYNNYLDYLAKIPDVTKEELESTSDLIDRVIKILDSKY